MGTNVDPIVSFADEPLILVDSDDQELGFENKAACHAGGGKLHRAFSVFLFDHDDALLLQQRSSSKELWPGYWTNSCCSHPRRGEESLGAATRRIEEELGITAALRFRFKFEYRATFEGRGTEHELCSVFIGRITGEAHVNRNEVAAWRFISPDELTRELAANAALYTPWLKIEWPRIRAEHWDTVTGL